MSKLLVQDTFHKFLFSHASITTSNTFEIDGTLQKSFFTPLELELEDYENRTLSYWQEIKPVCFELIKGKKTPLAFHFVFKLSEQNVEKLLSSLTIGLTKENINGLFLNIKFNGTVLQCITGVSINTFSLDRTLEKEWDTLIKKFFKTNEIAFEQLV